MSTLIAAAHPEQEICHDITLQVWEKINFSKTEKELLCDEVGAKPWSNIPPAQAEYFLRRFLEARGYFNPKFLRKDQTLKVDAGEISLVEDIQIKGSPIDIDITRYWQAFGRPMTSELLNGVENWILKELSQHGYPCGKIKSQAFSKTGEIKIDIEGRHLENFSQIKLAPIPGLVAGVEKRYMAFKKEDGFDALTLDLSAQRMVRDELVVSSTFNADCNAKGDLIKIKQHVVAGEPRLVTFGVGFDTEEYAVLEAGWKNNRMTSLASKFSIFGRASYRTQKVQSIFDWFYAPIVTKHSFKSDVTTTREFESEYETRETKVQSGPSWLFDVSGVGGSVWIGPRYTFTVTPRGSGPAITKSVALNLNLQLTSHDFEYYSADPRSGFATSFDLLTARKGIASEISATKYVFNGTYLKNLFHYDPAIWILGLRTRLTTTVVGEGTVREDLPPNMLEYLGGTTSLRGFGRRQVPESGALTTAYIGSEMRLSQIFPYGIQPISFIDWGRVGANGWNLDQTDFWSPGLGINWKSPIGVVRGTAAYGFVRGQDRERLSRLEAWHFYASYGEQF